MTSTGPSRTECAVDEPRMQLHFTFPAQGYVGDADAPGLRSPVIRPPVPDQPDSFHSASFGF